MKLNFTKFNKMKCNDNDGSIKNIYAAPCGIEIPFWNKKKIKQMIAAGEIVSITTPSIDTPHLDLELKTGRTITIKIKK